VRLLLVALLLAGCKSDRERDCERVRDTLGPHGGMPRRYYEYAPNHEAAPAIDPIDRLRQMTWHDAEVRAAVNATTASGWTAYTPYSKDVPFEQLRTLCAIETR